MDLDFCSVENFRYYRQLNKECLTDPDLPDYILILTRIRGLNRLQEMYYDTLESQDFELRCQLTYCMEFVRQANNPGCIRAIMDYFESIMKARLCKTPNDLKVL